MLRLFAPIALVAAAIASPATAAPTINCSTAANPVNCTFGNTTPPIGVGASGQFSDNYVFTIPFARTLTGSLTNFYTNFNQNVNFGPVQPFISGGTLAGPVSFAITATPNPDTRSIGPLLLGAGTYTINVSGFSRPFGTYEGTLAFGAVPEPATWAFMILGFGLIGATIRRRKVARRVAFA